MGTAYQQTMAEAVQILEIRGGESFDKSDIVETRDLRSELTMSGSKASARPEPVEGWQQRIIETTARVHFTINAISDVQSQALAETR